MNRFSCFSCELGFSSDIEIPCVYTIPCLITEDRMRRFRFKYDTDWFPSYNSMAVKGLLQNYTSYIQWHSCWLNPFVWHWGTSSYRVLNRLGRAIESVNWDSLQNTRSNNDGVHNIHATLLISEHI